MVWVGSVALRLWCSMMIGIGETDRGALHVTLIRPGATLNTRTLYTRNCPEFSLSVG